MRFGLSSGLYPRHPWTMHRYSPLSLLLPISLCNIVSGYSRARLISNPAMQLFFAFFVHRRVGDSKVYKAAHFSPSVSLQNSFYITLKWIPSLTSPPLKFPSITRVEEVQESLIALLRNPPLLRPPPTWKAAAEAPALLTALLPKWRIRVISYHNCASFSRHIQVRTA